MGLNAHQIHQIMSQADGSSLELAQAVSSNVSRQYGDLERQVRELSQMIAAGWQGNAAHAAQAGTTPLSTMVASAQGELGIHQKALGDQQRAVGDARKAVVPVAADPPQNNIFNEMCPFHTDLDERIDNYNNGAHTNVAAYNTYVQSSGSNGSTIPSSFPGVAPDGSNVTVTAPDQGGSTSGGWGSTPYSGTGGGTTRSSSAGSGAAPRVGGGAGPAGAGGWTGTPGAGGLRTDAAQWAGSPGTGGPGTGGPAGWGPGAGGPGSPAGNSPGFGPLSGGFGGVGGTEGGFGARGGAGSARFGSGAGAGGAGGSGRGGPGAGNAMSAAEEQAMGRGAAARGMAGAAEARGAGGGPMGAGGRGGKGEEDGEHRSASYLVGDRSDELAGELPLTAPPVIGE
jgi:hypothetical protein